MPNKKSCPNCRETVPRLLEHVRFCASDKTPEEHNLMSIEEVERGKRIVMQSTDIMTLKAEYPDSYWDIAEHLIKHDFPVYEKTDKRTTMRRRTWIVRRLTLDDIPRRPENTARIYRFALGRERQIVTETVVKSVKSEKC